MAGGEAAVEQEVRGAGHHVGAEVVQARGDAVALGGQRRHQRERVVGVLERGERGGLGQRREVVRQAHEHQRLDDRRRRGEVAEPPAGEGERLGHRAADHQLVAERLEQLDGRRAGRELDVGLVDDDEAGRRVGDRPQLAEVDRLAGGVVGRGHEQHVGLLLGDHRDGLVGVEREVVAPRRRDPLGARAGGEDRVHRVRRLEAQRAASRPAEGLQQLLEHLVRPVGGPEVLGGERDAGRPGQVGGERPAQGGVVAVGVAVERRGGLAGRRRRRSATSAGGGGNGFSLVLSATGTSSCGAPYGAASAQVVAQGQVVEGDPGADHVGHLSGPSVARSGP